MNINRTIPTLVELSFNRIVQFFNHENNALGTQEEVTGLVDIISQISFSCFKDFKFLRLLESRYVTLGLPSEVEAEITIIWSKFS